jgi:hypothetical protein
LGGASDVQVEARHPAWGTLLVGLDGALATVAWDALEGLYISTPSRARRTGTRRS